MPEETTTIKINPRKAFREYLTRTERFSCIVAHRRSGKTFACIQDIGIKALTYKRKGPPLRYAYIAPTREQAKDVAWGYLTEFFAPIEGVKINETNLSITLPDKQNIRLYSGENYERMRGIYFDGVIMDEYGDLSPDAWSEVVRPCLSDYEGWATFIGTAKGKNAFYHAYTGALEHAGWYTMMLKASQSGIIKQSELENIQEDPNITADQYRQEYECDFNIAPPGAIFLAEVEKAYKQGRISNDVGIHHEGIPVYTIGDIGLPINTKFGIFQPMGDKINFLQAFTGNSELNTPARWTKLFTQLSNERGYSYGCHFLPHDGETVWRPAFIEAGLSNVDVLPRPPNEWDPINEALRMFPRTYINEEECQGMIRALEAWSTKEVRNKSYWMNKPAHDWSSHWGTMFSQAAWAIACGRTINKAGKSMKPRRNKRIKVDMGFADKRDLKQRKRSISVIRG